MEAGDVEAMFALLAPDVRWGPADDSVSGCHNRRQVRAWYQAAFDQGVRATVTEVVPAGDHLLVGLAVTGRFEGGEEGSTERWQVLTVRDGLIADIRGFDDRREAAVRAGVPA
jgi:ketosteroid isomerase-like protein